MKITINKKEYECGKITRAVYKEFNSVFKEIENKEVYSDEDLDKMVAVIVKAYGEQFTEDEVNESFDVPDIIFNYSVILYEVDEKINKKIEKLKKNFQEK